MTAQPHAVPLPPMHGSSTLRRCADSVPPVAGPTHRRIATAASSLQAGDVLLPELGTPWDAPLRPVSVTMFGTTPDPFAPVSVFVEAANGYCYEMPGYRSVTVLRPLTV